MALLTCPAGASGYQLERLGSPPCVCLYKPNWPTCNMVVSGRSSNRTSPNGLALIKPLLAQPITMNNDVPLTKASHMARPDLIWTGIFILSLNERCGKESVAICNLSQRSNKMACGNQEVESGIKFRSRCPYISSNISPCLGIAQE